MEENLNSIV